MATSAGDEFDTWLIVKLKSLNTDEGVFSTYIKGILEGDETDDEKNESLEGIISGITEDDISQHCNEIFEQWRNLHHQENSESERGAHENVDDRLVKLLEKQAKPTVVTRSYTDEEKKLRDAILAQYSQMSDQDEDEEEDVVNGTSGSSSSSAIASGGATALTKTVPLTGSAPRSSGLSRNTNLDDVVRADRERREKAKQDAQRKKEKDREDREKQKKDQQEKKEKRKTQKGERRR